MKRIAAIMIASLFVLTAFAVVEMPMAMASTPIQNFSFPYSYGQPQVPSDVGAQGIQGVIGTNGPTVPLSDIGVQGHVGPVNVSDPESLGGSVIKVEFHILNGTVSSSTPSVDTTVILENVTFGTTYEGNTSVNGYLNLSVHVGYYLVDINNTRASGHIPFVDEEFINAATYTFYLLPTSYSTASVNGGTGTLWIVGLDSSYYGLIPGANVNVTLSGPSGPIVTAVTAANGSVEFTSVNTSDTYGYEVWGYSQPLTGIVYDLTNYTYSPEAFSSGQTIKTISFQYDLEGENSWTTTIIGSQPSKTSWSVSQNTTVSNGKFILSLTPSISTGKTLTFSNVFLILNASGGLSSSTVQIFIKNSTIITAGITNQFGGDAFSIDYSAIWGMSILRADQSNEMPFPYVNNSFISHLTTRYYQTDLGSIYNNDLIVNGQQGYAYNPSIAQNTLHSTILNMTVVDSDSNSTYSFDKFNNVSLTDEPTYVNYYGIYMYNDIFGPNVSAVSSTNIISLTTVTDGWINSSLLEITAPWYNYNDIGKGQGTVQLTAGVTYSRDVFTNPQLPAVGTTIYGDGIENSSFFMANASVSQFGYWGSNARYNASLSSGDGGFIIVLNPNHDSPIRAYFSNNNFQSKVGSSVEPYYNVTVKNNRFFDEWAPTTMIGSAYGVHDVITNNSFSGDYMNKTFFIEDGLYINGFTGFSGGATLFTGNASTNFTHNTVYTFFDGSGGPGVQDGLIGNTGNVTYNIFYNNQSSGPNAYEYPAGFDIFENAPLNFSNNWFLNLNPSAYSMMQMPSTGKLTENFYDNHFFFAPSPIESYVPLTSSVFGAGYPLSIDVGNNVTLKQTEESQLIENTSHLTHSASNLYFWTYNVTPDVNTLSGTPTISYSNGLVGGPQPNFTWDGYKYTESVEPSYIQVGVNSANAPPVNLQFNGAPNTAYSVAMYDNGQLIDYTNVTSSANGVVTFTYNSATMPLDPVFELTAFHIVTSGSTAVPPEVFLYVLLAGGALLGAGAIIVAAVDRRRYR